MYSQRSISHKIAYICDCGAQSTPKITHSMLTSVFRIFLNCPNAIHALTPAIPACAADQRSTTKFYTAEI